MIKTTVGALDGIHLRKFEAGVPYSIPDQITQKLADLFVKMEVAKVYRERVLPIAPPEIKPVAPPEIKIVEPESDPEIIEEDDSTVVIGETEEVPKKSIMRVYQLAEELDVASKVIIETATALGIHAPAVQSGLSQDEVDRITKGLS